MVVNGTITQGDGLCGSASGGAYGILSEFGSSIPWHAETTSSVDPAAGVAVGGGASGTVITVSSAAKNGAAGAVGLVIVRLIF
jgi:hypothetical protein